MAQNLTKDSQIEIVAEIKDGGTFDFVTTTSKIKSIINHFQENPSSLKDKFEDLTKKMNAFKDDDVALEKMTDRDMRVFMDCVMHWIFAYKFLLPEDIKLTITKKDN